MDENQVIDEESHMSQSEDNPSKKETSNDDAAADDLSELYQLLRPPQVEDQEQEAMYLSQMYSPNNENIVYGINAIVERFLFERRKRTGKTVPQGFQHCVLTSSEYDEFLSWRKVRLAKTRGRYFHIKWDKALELWTKEAEGTEIDTVSLLQRVDSDGWVSLSPTELHYYELWRDWKWRQLEEEE